METPVNHVRFQFISEPGDINFGGKVHGGVVMKWLDEVAYTCARTWAETYCVTVYVGGIRFYKPIGIGELVRIDARVIYTGTTSIHIAVDLYARPFDQKDFEKKTHCIMVFVSVGPDGKPVPVRKWIPETAHEKQLAQYAVRLKELREGIEAEMQAFLK